MNGSATRIVKFLSGDDKRFVIPVYQRTYDWKIEQCAQLFDDLMNIKKKHYKNHFFGSIVSVYDEDGINEEYLIIDGQQRLTTVSLLFLAMYNALNKEIVTAQDNQLQKKILYTYLIDRYKSDETKMKLKHIKADSDAYIRLYSEEADFIEDSNITINYNYFLDCIKEQKISIDELYDAICRLEIINIKLTKEDNPQLVFESLNSTGLNLNEGDKIRNFVLMGLDKEKQNEFYKKYWLKIEKNVKDTGLFIRDYLSIKKLSTSSLDKVYSDFKKYFINNNFEIEDVLKDLLEYSRFYKILLDGETKNVELNNCIYRLNRLSTTVTRPFFMEVLHLQKDNMIPLEDLVKIFFITENYLFRRSICDLPTNMLNKIFLILNKEIYNLEKNYDKYLDKFKYILLSKTERARFPKDTEFINSFSNRQIYHMNNKNKMYIMERFENFGTKETKNIYNAMENGTYTIEHIMPQTLTPEWMDSLGEDYDRIHEIWLHRMANLTLTAYNSKYSNRSFNEKKTMENGFLYSGIRMNQVISSFNQWTENELVERDIKIREYILKIWPNIETSYKPIQKPLDIVSLEDEVILTNREIIKYNLRGMEQNIDSWTNMFVYVLRSLNKENPAILKKLLNANEKDNSLSIYVGHKETFKYSHEIVSGIYVWTNTGTQAKINLLRRFFDEFGVNQSELSFILKPQFDNNNQLEEKNELLFEYWNMALPIIRNNTNLFTNVSPRKDYWINGSIGINGIHYVLRINTNSAGVEFYIEKNLKEDNKKIFDELFENKEIIDKQFKYQLLWDRGDNKKSSKLSVVYTHFNLFDKYTWNEAIQFQIKKVNLMHKLIFPYIQKIESQIIHTKL